MWRGVCGFLIEMALSGEKTSLSAKKNKSEKTALSELLGGKKLSDSGIDLVDLIQKFVKKHDKNGKQRSVEWFKLMADTFGGSEVASLFNSGYNSREAAIASKVLPVPFIKKRECTWGVIFEVVIGRVVEIDCETEIYGDTMCITVLKGHRYSPDGYCVMTFYIDDEGQIKIWTPICGKEPAFQAIVLLEFKSPYSRLPDGSIPRYYKPQLWSGLTVSPIAAFGMFVEAVFRKCALEDLGDNENYDKDYHCKKQVEPGTPFAWGMIAVYAPLLDAPAEIRCYEENGKNKDAACDAWRMASSYMGSADLVENEIIDFGECSDKIFDDMLAMIENKKFSVTCLEPCLQDGRGNDLHSGKKIKEAISAAQKTCPDHHYMLGIIPWKLFELHYIKEDRKHEFEQQMVSKIDEAWEIIKEARECADPETFLKARREQVYAEKRSKRSKKTVAQHHEFFKSIQQKNDET